MVREVHREVRLDPNPVARPVHRALGGNEPRDTMSGELAFHLDLFIFALLELLIALLAEDDFADLEVNEGVLLGVEPAVAL